MGTKQWEAEMAKKEQRRLNREARAGAKVAAATAKEMEEDAEEKARRARIAGNDVFLNENDNRNGNVLMNFI